jgi:flagellar biosynthetic protein FlhB
VAEEGPGGDRSEAATPRRLQQAREAGQVALSPEAAPFAVLAIGALLLSMAAPSAARLLLARLATFLTAPAATPPATAVHAALAATFLLAAPFLLCCALAGTVAVLAQTRGLVNLDALAPDLARLDPRRGLKRIFSATALLESAKSVVKIAVVTWAGWQAVGSTALPRLRQAMDWDATTLVDRASHQMIGLLLAMLAAQAVIATLDLLYVRLHHLRGLRMSRQELMDEHKEMEGDPTTKRRIRQLRVQRARRRMLKAVPRATVVVTNPTHYAIALAYDRAKGGAPRVVAKGVDSMAARIRELAQDNRVPVIANPPLAQALYRVELDAEIPAEHYQAVAGIIAYVWRLRGIAVGKPA